jgi:tetratricopeptide (TPR) repeat protein
MLGENDMLAIDDHALLTLLELSEADMGPERADDSIERSDLAQAKAETLHRLGRQDEAKGAFIRAQRTRAQALADDQAALVQAEGELARRLLDMGAVEEALSAWGRAFEILITQDEVDRRLLDGMVTYGRHLMKRADKKSERRLLALGELFSRASRAA